MTHLLDGKKLALGIEKELSILKYKAGFAIVLIGNHAPSLIYVKRKKSLAERLGVHVQIEHLDAMVTQGQALKVIETLNYDKRINGIIIQLPVPKHLDTFALLTAVDPNKDIDGLHPFNLGLLEYKKHKFIPCTPQGCCQLILSVCPNLAGKKVTVIGRSVLVGKTLSTLLLHLNATVTVTHSRSADIAEISRESDIIISAVGSAHFVKADFIKEGAIVIDVGSSIKDEKLAGDVDFEDVKEHVRYITPVPGGVGPMTVINLMVNTYLAYSYHNDLILPDIIRKCTRFY